MPQLQAQNARVAMLRHVMSRRGNGSDATSGWFQPPWVVTEEERCCVTSLPVIVAVVARALEDLTAAAAIGLEGALRARRAAPHG
jgi:hypothetical protein